MAAAGFGPAGIDAAAPADTSWGMDSLPHPYRAVVVGASGGIGSAFVKALAADSGCARIDALSRSGAVPEGAKIAPGPIDVTDEASVAKAAARIAEGAPPRLVLVATGHLHGPEGGPEKSWSQLTPESLARNFALNATGPALVAKHLLPLMPREGRAILAALSARVGSVADNRIGGWYGYRASKAALNQILRCLAIEGARKRPDLVIAGLQPGTVRTGLSRPFRGRVAEEDLFEPDTAAGHLLGVLDGLSPAQSGRLFDWRGEEFPP